MHGNAHEHFLHPFHETPVPGPDEIAAGQQIQSRMFEQSGAVRIHAGFQTGQIFCGIAFQQTVREQMLLREPDKLLFPGLQAQFLFILPDFQFQFMVEDPGCNILPSRGIPAGEFRRCPFQKPEPFLQGLARTDQFRSFDLQPVQRIPVWGKSL